jgi:rod shape-determining protein MreD
MKAIPYILYLLLIGFYRTLLVDPLSIGQAQIYLAALLVILVGLNKDDLTALWFGFAVGLVYDAITPDFMGAQMLILSVIGIGTAQAKNRFNLESQKSLVFLTGAGLLLFSIPYILIYGTSGISEFGTIFLKSALPSIIYTMFFGWLFFVFQSGQISFQKLKSIF